MSKIVDFYYKHEQKVLKGIPVIGLIIILVITFVLNYSDVPFLIKINNAKSTLLDLFNFSNMLQLVRNIVVVITVWSGYMYWLKRVAVIRENSKLVESIIIVISLLIFTEHINLSSPIGQFIDWIFYLAIPYLLFAGLLFLSKVKKSINFPYKSKPKEDSKAFDYISDAEITDPALDKFKRWPFAQSIAEKIALRHDTNSIVFGIYGAWGEGKSTVLNFIEIGLKNEHSIICIRFNPWRFDDETSLLRNFFQTLADGLGKSIYSPNEKIGEWIRNYAAILSLTISGGVQLSPSEVGKKVSSVELDELKNRIGVLLINEGKHIVILIDDIDRLDKKEIQIIFKLVKLSANFTNTTYVLAFDEDIVSEALGENYGSGDKEAGRSFIEKIVQVPLYLPKADTMALRNICFEYVYEILKDSKINLTQEQNQAFVTHFIDCLETRLKTPRMATRYGNALFSMLPALRGQVNYVDLLLTEGLQIFYPKLYEIIRNNSEIFLCSWKSSWNTELAKKHSIEIIEEGLDGLNSDEKQCAKNLLRVLFPRIDGIYGNTSYGPESDERWAEEQRIASKQYFNRFFSYTVPEGDISDIELEYFIKQIESDTISNIASDIQKFVNSRSAELFVLKLRRKVNALSPDTSRNLAIAIAKVGDVLPKSEGVFFAATAFSQAGYLVSQLLRKIPNEKDRLDAAKAIFQEGSIFFVTECFSWIRTTKERKEQDRIFSIEMENELGRIMVEKIKQFSHGPPIYRQCPDNAPYLLYIWLNWGSREETNQYLTKTLEANPRNALELLKCYLPTLYSASGVHKGGFERDQYNSIIEVVDADVIFNALYKIYGSEIDSQKNHRENRTPDEWIAYQFVHIYHLVKTDEKNATSKKEGHEM